MTDERTMKTTLMEIGKSAKAASAILANTPAAIKNQWLLAMADALDSSHEVILSANAEDMERGRAKGMSSAMLDRLLLTPDRIKGISDALRYVTTLEDPVGHVLSSVERPNGIKINKVSVPIGVIGFIFESRPNVTVDAAGLCLKSGNAVILRGGEVVIPLPVVDSTGIFRVAPIAACHRPQPLVAHERHHVKRVVPGSGHEGHN